MRVAVVGSRELRVTELGTRHVIDNCKSRGIPVKVFVLYRQD